MQRVNAVTDQHKNLFNNRLVENVSTFHIQLLAIIRDKCFPLVFSDGICQLPLLSIAFSKWIRFYCAYWVSFFTIQISERLFNFQSFSSQCCCRHFFMFVCWSVCRRQLCCEKVTDLRRFSLAFSWTNAAFAKWWEIRANNSCEIFHFSQWHTVFPVWWNCWNYVKRHNWTEALFQLLSPLAKHVCASWTSICLV